MKLSSETVILLIHSAFLFVGIPGMVYYVENHAPYVKERAVIELQLKYHEQRLAKLEEIVERITSK